MSSADRSDKPSGKKSTIRKYRLPIIVTIISVGLSIFAGLYGMGEKCQNDIDAINHVIKTKGGIDTNSQTWQQIGIDGCADLEKSPKGYITTEIQP